jgi:hypothetical protein
MCSEIAICIPGRPCILKRSLFVRGSSLRGGKSWSAVSLAKAVFLCLCLYSKSPVCVLAVLQLSGEPGSLVQVRETAVRRQAMSHWRLSHKLIVLIAPSASQSHQQPALRSRFQNLFF